MSDDDVQINHNKGRSDVEGSDKNLEETVTYESEASHTITEDVTLEEVKGMDPDTLQLFL